MAGAPLGNQNALKGKRWRDAIDRALEKRSKAEGIQALDQLAEEFLKAVKDGEQQKMPGYRELGDRLDGKASQPVEATGTFTINIVD